MSDTVTLELQGSVSLEQFAEAVRHFQALIDALSEESRAEGIRWEITALDVSSATVTSQGVSPNGAIPEIEQVVRNYLEVGQALEGRTTIPYSRRIKKEAEGIAAVVRSGVKAVVFQTAESEAIIREPRSTAPGTLQPLPLVGSYGAVTGRVQTLTSRSHLRFTLYDRLHDRAVSCYLAEGQESLMREMWDKLATVEGWVTRDPLSGRPLSVRRISNVTRLDEAGPQDYMKARGALLLGSDDSSPEEAIRRLRDGE